MDYYTKFFQENPDFFYKTPNNIINDNDLNTRFSSAFPKDFIDFYKKYNGGIINPISYVEYLAQESMLMSTEKATVLTVEKLYSLMLNKDSEDAFYFTEIQENQYPLALENQTDILDLNQIKIKYQDYIIFGSNNGGSNLWLLGVNDSNFGHVFYWAEDDNEEYNPHLVFKNFKEFIQNLIIEP